MNKVCVCAALLSFCVWGIGTARDPGDYFTVDVVASRGADSRVDYSSLVAYGPWDDRNYEMTKADVELLAKDEASLKDPIPAFFRALYRREHPYMSSNSGERYPRSAFNEFKGRFNGYLIDGRFYRGVERAEDGWRYFKDSGYTPNEWQKFLVGESRVTNPNDAAESAIAINPLNDDIVIAGSNGPTFAQIMHLSTDGGETWSQAGALPLGGTCCDPTVGWSSDATLAYTATLGNCGGGCSIWFYRSDDMGATWTGLENETPGDPRRELTNGGSDKEFLHVDTYPTSPHLDNIYLTWHDGNIMQFARSTDFGNNFTVTSFSAFPRGIGSDIVTDKNGDVYYFWPAFLDETILLLKSTDGGATFPTMASDAIVVANTQDGFDFAIPVMETRRVFIYVSADVDYSDGPFGNSIYAAWTDSTAAEGSTANNHARIQVGYSRDGGMTWNTSTPHSTADMNTVDRFHQWMDVDENGVVHIVYYDTSGDLPGRNAVDLFYTYSTDGAVTWETPIAVTTEMSPNITDGFEWGDYNGLDIVGQELIAIFTDNRDESGGSAESVDVYAAAGFGVFGDGFNISASPQAFDVCTVSGSTQNSTVSVSVIGMFSGDVNLAVNGGLPTGFSNAQFVPSTVTVPDTSAFSVDIAAATATGQSSITIEGTDDATGMITDDAVLMFSTFDSLPATTVLQAPADMATDLGLSPVFSWDPAAGASTYTLEVATDSGFTSIVDTVVTENTTAVLSVALNASTEYFWRVTADNVCGTGTTSAVRSFTTAALYCSAPGVAIPDNTPAGIGDGLMVADSGILTDLNVTLDVTHTWVGDLIVTLEKNGTSIALMDRPGFTGAGFGCGEDDISATFDDAGGAPVEDECDTGGVAIMGTLIPQEALSTFNNTSLAGDWTLSISDNAGFDTGTLDMWCLSPATVPGETLGIVFAGLGGGTVTSMPAGIDCTSDCSAEFASGGMVTLSATPDGSSQFAGWTGGGCSGTADCVVTLNAMTEVTATFEPLIDLTVMITGGGTVVSAPAGIDCPGTCSAGFATGEMVTLTASKASSTFVGWSGGGCSGTGTCDVIMNSAVSVEAIFDSADDLFNDGFETPAPPPPSPAR